MRLKPELRAEVFQILEHTTPVEPSVSPAESVTQLIRSLPGDHFVLKILRGFDRHAATLAPLDRPHSVVNAVTLAPLTVPVPVPDDTPLPVTPDTPQPSFKASAESAGPSAGPISSTPSPYSFLLSKLSLLPNSDLNAVRLYTTLNSLYPKRSEDPETLIILLSQCEFSHYSN